MVECHDAPVVSGVTSFTMTYLLVVGTAGHVAVGTIALGFSKCGAVCVTLAAGGLLVVS